MNYKRNKSLSQSVKGQPCEVCGQPGEMDHVLNFKRIKSRDQQWNAWSLCRKHHHEKTHYGLYRFANNYNLQFKLLDKGFEFCDFSKRWIHKNDN